MCHRLIQGAPVGGRKAAAVAALLALAGSGVVAGAPLDWGDFLTGPRSLYVRTFPYVLAVVVEGFGVDIECEALTNRFFAGRFGYNDRKELFTDDNAALRPEVLQGAAALLRVHCGTNLLPIEDMAFYAHYLRAFRVGIDELERQQDLDVDAAELEQCYIRFAPEIMFNPGRYAELTARYLPGLVARWPQVIGELVASPAGRHAFYALLVGILSRYDAPTGVVEA